MNNLEKTKRLIREGQTTVHENLTDAMISIKKNNPNLSHGEVMSIFKDEFDKFFVKGNKTAATRVRKFMQEIKKKSQEIRDDVQDYRKSI